ncbi:V-type ATPase subunit [Dysosmobacter acutus]|nr:V-type ATPase subunit [Dysosmobacter acutus]
MSHIKDTDYLFLSSRIKAMENSLLSRDRLEELLESRSEEEISKTLEECGYPKLSAQHPEEMDEALSAARQEMLEDLSGFAPDGRYLELFRIKYDYHNLKVLLKAQAMETDPGHMLMNLGRVDTALLRGAEESGELDELPRALAEGYVEAKEVLQTTGDPQLSDVVLDRRCYREMRDLAESTGSDFLVGYVKTMIDAVNLRTLVRTLRMGKSPEFLSGVVFEGGTVPADAVCAIAVSGGSNMGEAYASTVLAEAAEAGAAALSGGPLTRFEKLCDDAVSDYLADAKYVAFGEAPLVGYLAARETEFTNLRILLMGRAAGLSPEIIRERLREAYV